MISADGKRQPSMGSKYDALDADDIIIRLSSKARLDYLKYLKGNNGSREALSRCEYIKELLSPIIHIVDTVAEIAKQHDMIPGELFSEIDIELSQDSADPKVKEYIYIMMNSDSIVHVREAMMLEFDANIVKTVYAGIIKITKGICDRK